MVKYMFIFIKHTSELPPGCSILERGSVNRCMVTFSFINTSIDWSTLNELLGRFLWWIKSVFCSKITHFYQLFTKFFVAIHFPDFFFLEQSFFQIQLMT